MSSVVHSRPRWQWWLIPALLLLAAGAGGCNHNNGSGAHPGHSDKGQAVGSSEASDTSSGVKVEVARPKRGGLTRTTTQACNVEGFEHDDLYAQVSGYVDKQYVDIGSEVKKGDLLIEISVPELVAEKEKAEAGLEHARARVEQFTAKVATASADVEAAKAVVKESEEEIKSKEAYQRYRKGQYQRIRALAERGSIEERIADEERDRRDAAIAAYEAAKATVKTSEAKLVAARARLDEAKADLKAAGHEVSVFKAEAKAAEAQVNFAKIYAPFNGVITNRTMFPGSFVRTAVRGGGEPLLSVTRTDVMRVVLPIPDRDVPLTKPGEEAEVRLDALPGKVFKATVSRVSYSEDPQTRTMRCEVDVKNPLIGPKEHQYREIQPGMYGSVTILLHKGEEDALTIPASCLVGKAEKKGHVYVIRDGNKAHLVEIEISMDDGEHIEVTRGLKPDDLVASSWIGPIGDGVTVAVGSSPGESSGGSHGASHSSH